jgi:hypothetical protein
LPLSVVTGVVPANGEERGGITRERRERRESGCHTGCSPAKEGGHGGRAPDVDHGHQWQRERVAAGAQPPTAAAWVAAWV